MTIASHTRNLMDTPMDEETDSDGKFAGALADDTEDEFIDNGATDFENRPGILPLATPSMTPVSADPMDTESDEEYVDDEAANF